MLSELILRTLVIGTDEALATELLRTLLHSCRSITPQLAMPRTENREIEEILKLQTPSCVFLEAEDLHWCIQAAAEIHRVERTMPIIAFSRYIDTPSVLGLMRAGVREWVQAPVDKAALHATVERIRAELHELGDKARRASEFVCFLPCKPGSGSSTVAAHAASLCAKAAGSPVALFDLDLTCGTLQFITEAVGGTSLFEAAQHAYRIDESLWGRFIATRGGIHLMHCTQRGPEATLDPHQLHRLLSYAVSKYPVVIADLSGSHESFAIHALEQSTQIYMVCSPDLTSLYLARRQLHFLKELGFLDRLELIVNRATFHVGLGKTAIEEILERKPVAYFPNAYLPLQKALKERALLSEEAPFSRSVSELVARIMNLQTPSPEARHPGGGWMARAKFTNTLQALKAAIYSLRPAGASMQNPAEGIRQSWAGYGDTSAQLSKPVVAKPGLEPVAVNPDPALMSVGQPAAGPQQESANRPAPRRRRTKGAAAPKKAKQSA
ncbi:MAG: hypothetical protein IH602_17225 [Bryobacteraceae bacterium]|nr:hypothetical protein [Bryobacteraceae bacterium]